MQPPARLKKIQLFFEALQSKYALNRCFILLTLFLLAVILISFIIPVISFGRFFGTDDYTHLFHTQQMVSSTGISDFFEKMGGFSSNPSSGENLYNYPFAVWLFGGTIAKITGLPILSGVFIFIILFFFVIIGSFYVYSDVFLKSKEQKILAVLFLLSMPNVIPSLLAYRPSVFILPFLFILIYITFKEPFQWKLLPLVWLSIFLIIVSHTGTFIFLVSVSVLFFLLYCLLWGRVSLPMYLVIVSTFVIYIFSLAWFPQIFNQYAVKSTLFLSPGTFLAENFNFYLPLELGNIFYQNVVVNQEFIYTIIIAAFIFVLGKLFRSIHRNVSEKFSRSEQIYPVTLPLSNISHSVAATPLWIGPIHVILSFIGFFRLDSKGKCLLISLLLVTILPDMLFEGSGGATGILREISFLVLIIPITAALGFWVIISYLDTLTHPQKILISFAVWVVVLLAVIITPVLFTAYYLPKSSGEDYIIEGMQWLGNNGVLSEKIIGYGYRMVPVYTNMTDVGYGIQSGYETRTFIGLLKGTFFSSGGSYVYDLQRLFSVKYILTSDKVVENLKGSGKALAINDNAALNKIYSSRDFGVYDIVLSSETPVDRKVLGENFFIKNTGSSIQIETDVYKVVLNGKYPVIEQFGTPTDNYLGEGFIVDSIDISGFRQQPYSNPFSPPVESPEQNSTADVFRMDNVFASPEIIDNQIIYRTILKDQQNGKNEASLLIRYTFYPESIKREFLISNDWVTSSVAPQMSVGFSTSMFVPLNDFVLKSNKALLKRHIYPSQDSVGINENIQDLYVYDGNRGINIKNEPTAAYPTSLVYKGSTIYNISSVSVSQTESLKPGATLHITQFLSPGDEVTAGKNILTQDRICLLNYPDGMIPIILSGYRTPHSDIRSPEFIEQGYSVLLTEGVPYSEVVVPEMVSEIPVSYNNMTKSAEPSATIQTTTSIIDTVDLRAINSRNIKIIGSGSTTGVKTYNNYSTQEKSISSLIEYANDEDVRLIGYMPGSMDYNLDTLKIISDKNIPFMLSTPVSPPYYGAIGTETKHPQQALYHNELSGVTLLPVSYPMSSSLSTQTDTFEILSAWKATIDESVITDGMILFIIRSSDIGNPDYTEDIKSLISYAKTKGLTFTTPDVIVDHFKKIQKIQYSGSVQGDKATINLTNNNEETVQQVTIRVVLPALKTGNYNASGGRIVRTKTDNDNIIFYVSADIPAHETKEITIEPADTRKTIVVTLPRQPIEGLVKISIKDITGKPLTGAEVIIDTKYYQPDKNGDITIDFKRGIHTVQIENSGYETYRSTLNVKGRIFIIEQFFKNNS
jgi:hypothetical protein